MPKKKQFLFQLNNFCSGIQKRNKFRRHHTTHMLKKKFKSKRTDNVFSISQIYSNLQFVFGHTTKKTITFFQLLLCYFTTYSQTIAICISNVLFNSWYYRLVHFIVKWNKTFVKLKRISKVILLAISKIL